MISLMRLMGLCVSFARSAISSSVCGTNSCNGGSRKRIVTGWPSSASKSCSKSSCWYGRIFASAISRSSTVSAQIIWRNGRMRLCEKNMCSVRQRPIPSAPSSRAFFASRGVSALVRTFRRRNLSAHIMMRPNSPAIVASTVGTTPS